MQSIPLQPANATAGAVRCRWRSARSRLCRQRSSLLLPTPGISARAISEAGRRRAISLQRQIVKDDIRRQFLSARLGQTPCAQQIPQRASRRTQFLRRRGGMRRGTSAGAPLSPGEGAGRLRSCFAEAKSRRKCKSLAPRSTSAAAASASPPCPSGSGQHAPAPPAGGSPTASPRSSSVPTPKVLSRSWPNRWTRSVALPSSTSTR